MRRIVLGLLTLLALSASSFAAKDPADYAVKVIILEQHWTSHNLAHNEFRATGRGNVWEGDSVRAFDFQYDCHVGLKRTVRNQPYIAKWRKPQLRLMVLAPRIGSEDKYNECELETTVRDGVYMIGNTGLTEMPQTDFKQWRTQRDSARRSQQRSPSAPATKVAIASAPAGAEIEVDGEFVGDTPSSLELTHGTHTISIMKSGYKTWEKKITLAPGDIKLNADLLPENEHSERAQ
jgi:PEGA domain